MEEKKFEKINEEELGLVSGGTGGSDGSAAQVLPTESCPVCSATNMVQLSEVIDRVWREVSVCTSCHRAFYFNDAGEMVTFRHWS